MPSAFIFTRIMRCKCCVGMVSGRSGVDVPGASETKLATYFAGVHMMSGSPLMTSNLSRNSEFSMMNIEGLRRGWLHVDEECALGLRYLQALMCAGLQAALTLALCAACVVALPSRLQAASQGPLGSERKHLLKTLSNQCWGDGDTLLSRGAAFFSI